MSGIGLEDPVLFSIGPVPIPASLATGVGITAVLSLASFAATRKLSIVPGRAQAIAEVFVSATFEQVAQVAGRGGRAFAPLLGTLFLYIAAANLSMIVPTVHPPTERLETPLALALVVFFSVHVAGVATQGLRGYLGHYLKPSPLLLPLHLISEVTRTFSLTMRLFGNMMSHGLVLAVVAALAGLLVPIPLVALGLLVGVIQAYIFSVLATTYLGAAVDAPAHEAGKETP